MRSITGKYLSFPQLQKYIEEHKAEEGLFLSLALLFGNKEIRQYESWNSLAEQFFNTFSEQIHACCGYDSGLLELQKIEPENPDLFILYLGAMMRNGVFGDCSFAKLAKYICLIFKLDLSESTVLNKLKDQDPEFEDVVERIRADKKALERRNRKIN